MKNMENKGPKILILDIETAPILANVWGLFDQNIGLNQIQQDWSILAYSAKWLGEKKVFYADQRNAKSVYDDKELLKGIWSLMNEADVIIGQNSKKFDNKKLNARFIINGMKPPSSYQQIDTLVMAKKSFAFTSNKLEYLSSKLCTKFKKLVKRKFDGFRLWSECIAGNKAAWSEMERYNKIDVLATEELYLKLAPWDKNLNFDIYNDDIKNKCSCGSLDFVKNGFNYTSAGRYQRYECKKCGAEYRDNANLLSKIKKRSLKIKVGV